MKSTRYTWAPALAAALSLGAHPFGGAPGNVPESLNPAAGSAALVFSTYLAGTGASDTTVATAVAVDPAGSIYVAGYTSSPSLPVMSAFQTRSGGGVDAFVAKLSAQGALLYCTYLGGASDDRALAIAVDGSGSAYVTGWTSSTDFPLAGNSHQRTLASGLDAFVARVSAGGNVLVFSTYLGGYGNDWGRGIALDAGGNVYIAGQTASSNFPTMNPIQSWLKGAQNGFVAGFDGSGNLLFSTYLGGSGTDTAAAIAVDTPGGLYITGATNSPDFPTLNAFQAASGGYQDAFVAKLNPLGAGLAYSTYLGGSGGSVVDLPEAGFAIDVDAGGSAYVTGVTSSANFPLLNPIQPAFGGWVDAFVTKFAPSGKTLLYSTYLGGVNLDYGAAIRVDSVGNACAAGYSTSSDFPVAGPIQTGNAGSYDAFVSCLNASGSTLVLSTLLGGTNSDAAYGLAVSGRSVIVAGETASTNFPLSNPAQGSLTGLMGGFAAMLTIPCTYAIAPTSATGGATAWSGGVTVVAQPGCAWAATSSAPSWLSVTSGASGAGGGTVGYSVAANPNSTARGATLTIGGQSFAVTQAGAACTYSISPTGVSVGAGGTTGSVTVTTPGGCAWTASSDSPSWASITSGSPGSGNGTVGYSVAANPNGTARGATFTIGGQSFSVTQAGIGCTYSINPTSASVTASGATGSVAVGAPGGCAWTASSGSPSWAAITSGSSGSGNGTAGYSVAANTSGTARAATLTIGGQAFSISQAGIACTYSLSAQSASVASGGGTGSVGVTAVAGCPWAAATDSPSWLAITSGTSGSGSGTVAYSVTGNATGAVRTGNLTIAGFAYTVMQSNGCTYTLSPSTSTIGYAGGDSLTFNVTTSASNCAWSVNTPVGWLKALPDSGTGNATIYYSVYPNYATGTRVAALGVGGQNYTITQTGAPGTADQRYVELLYFNFYGRRPSADEVAFQVTYGVVPQGRAQVALNFFTGQEFVQGGRYITGLYFGLLGRAPDYNGWLFQRNAMARNIVDPFTLIDNFLGGAEFGLHGTMTDTQFVTLLYNQILLRAPDPQGLADQVAGIQRYGRTQISYNMLSSAEFQANTGPQMSAYLLYACLLQRDATAAETTAMVNQINQGATFLSLIGNIIATPEFALLNQ